MPAPKSRTHPAAKPRAKRIEIHFERAADYRLLPMTGAFGGANAQGNVVADVYVERKLPPESIVYMVLEDEPSEGERKGERIVREVLAGLVMSPGVARSFGTFLIKKADLAEKIIAQGHGEDAEAVADELMGADGDGE